VTVTNTLAYYNLPTNIKLQMWCLTIINTLAYYNLDSIEVKNTPAYYSPELIAAVKKRFQIHLDDLIDR
jgi:hypothetical protein